tara:strand:+ start:270 stop:1064 length:795 start_codon:yes stop_codon:yes gene_type:complete
MSSKIKVDTIENVAGSGNVSLGSGHNLVVPGNITGSGTATITGDLTVDTSTLKVDATNNRVGIGVTSPSRKLELNNGGTGNLVTFTDGVATNFTFKTDGSNVGTFGTEAGSTHLAFMSSGTERMRIHSAGYTTKYNPAFRVSRTAGNYTSAATIVWNNVIYNQGSHYDSSNGRFTAPVAGIYQFNVMGSITASPANSGIHRAWINGNAQADMFPIATSSASHISYSSSFVFNLSANDYVYITAASGTWYGTGNVHNHFSGFLIG